jgi:hypothetical protein
VWFDDPPPHFKKDVLYNQTLSGFLIDCIVLPLSAIFQLYHGDQF